MHQHDHRVLAAPGVERAVGEGAVLRLERERMADGPDGRVAVPLDGEVGVRVAADGVLARHHTMRESRSPQ